MKITNYETAYYVVMSVLLLFLPQIQIFLSTLFSNIVSLCSLFRDSLSFKPIHSNGVTLNYLSEGCTLSSYWVPPYIIKYILYMFRPMMAITERRPTHKSKCFAFITCMHCVLRVKHHCFKYFLNNVKLGFTLL
jgi:hypothetical protein